MKKKKRKTKILPKNSTAFKEALSFYESMAGLKKELTQLAEGRSGAEKRMFQIEKHLNILTRLLATLCIERFGMKAAALKRLVRRIEAEVARESQITELESLYRLSDSFSNKNPSSSRKEKDDPWEKIS